MSADSFCRPFVLLVSGAMFVKLLDGTVLTSAATRMADAFAVPVSAMAVPIARI